MILDVVTAARDAATSSGPRATRSTALLGAATFTSGFDRFATVPTITVIAASFGVSVSRAAAAAAVYYLLYGLVQPVWAGLSERWGRVTVLRVALGLGGVAGLVVATAPSLAVLIAARALGGASLAAIQPTAIVYVGETVPLPERQRSLASLVGAASAGTATAVGLGAVLAALDLWRLAFALPAALSLLLAVAARLVTEPETGPSAGPTAVARLRAALTERRPRTIVLLALAEGAVVIGSATFLSAALQSGGAGALAGAGAALYGVGIGTGSLLLRPLLARLRPPRLILLGGLGTAAGFVLVAVESGHLVGVACGALLVGMGFSVLHTTMQTWATLAAPANSASVVGLFAGALFVGSSITTQLLAPLVDAERFALLFGTTAAAVLVFTAVAAILRARTRDDA